MGTREQDALNAYLTLLESKGLAVAELTQRKFVLTRLMLYIENVPSEGLYYRRAVDKFFNKMQPLELEASIPVIRDFFSFWMKDIKAIAAMSQGHEFEMNGQAWQPETSNLKNLWESLDKVVLAQAEAQALASYVRDIGSRNSDDRLISTREKLAKLLLLRLRNVPHKQPNAYRKVVDASLTLFKHKETHHVFLKVGREFYNFWRGQQHQDAAYFDTAIAA